MWDEIRTTHCYQYIDQKEWKWLMGYITTGSPSLDAYDEFNKVVKEDNLYVVKERRVAMRHRLSIGTIMSDASLRVKFQHGKYLGTIEESFISRLKPGDVFWFAGRSVEFLRIREMTVTVKMANSNKAIVPQWLGGRMSLSSKLSAFIRKRLSDAMENPNREVEMEKLMPLLELQDRRSKVPRVNELLIEQYTPADDVGFRRNPN